MQTVSPSGYSSITLLIWESKSVNQVSLNILNSWKLEIFLYKILLGSSQFSLSQMVPFGRLHFWNFVLKFLGCEIGMARNHTGLLPRNPIMDGCGRHIAIYRTLTVKHGYIKQFYDEGACEHEIGCAGISCNTDEVSNKKISIKLIPIWSCYTGLLCPVL